MNEELKAVIVGYIWHTHFSSTQAGSVYDVEQISPSITICQGGWRQPMFIVQQPDGVTEPDEK